MRGRKIEEPTTAGPVAPNTVARKPGSMAGESWMADDFDELPADMAEVVEALAPNR
jgi:hypothetical protein